MAPADLAAEEMVLSIPEGTKVLMDFRKARHPSNHAHFFAILNAACEQLEGYPDTETLLDAIKIAVNFTRPVKRADGEIVWLPKSINFASLDEDAFRRFKARALYVLGQLLGTDPVELLNEASTANQRNRR